MQAAAKHVKLLTDFSIDLPLAFADLRWIDRVLQNLLDNALRFVYEGGFVMFTVFEKDNVLNFKVCNSGDPIPEAHLDRVFDRTKRQHRRRWSKNCGTQGVWHCDAVTLCLPIIDLLR
ncbi:MAG: hypothetical protein IPL27_21260 [Lewinellaceae bacterium]|nr:hypothetical protein [Lewinellaceae bacterium]